MRWMKGANSGLRSGTRMASVILPPFFTRRALNAFSAPLRVRLGYHDRNNDTAVLKDTENARNLVLGAVYANKPGGH